MADVFISYSHFDEESAKKIEKRLTGSGISTFMAEKSIHPGQRFPRKIRKNLISAKAIFILITPNSVKSNWVNFEIGASWALGKPVFPILHECNSDAVPEILRKWHAINFVDLDSAIEAYKLQYAGANSCHYVGIDVGKGNIEYCLVDSSQLNNKDGKGVLYGGTVETNPCFDEVYNQINEIIGEIVSFALGNNISTISGIGIGLPGTVNPVTGVLAHSPSFDLRNELFVKNLIQRINWDDESLKRVIPNDDTYIPIEIDNDVRCATRWQYLVNRPKRAGNLVCIFVGNGLGSGIVINDKMYYGQNFYAGEAGHTSISYHSDVFDDTMRCHCDRKGHHWEMHVCSYGMIRMAEHIDRREFDRISQKYLPDGDRGLTTYDIKKAFLDGDPYAIRIVDKFLEFLAIGIANYISILNPEAITLGGGMIRAFNVGERESPFKKDFRNLLYKKVEEYIIPHLYANNLIIDLTSKQYQCSIGASLIFKDSSFSEYVKEHK